jgi:hypothetical protein
MVNYTGINIADPETWVLRRPPSLNTIFPRSFLAIRAKAADPVAGVWHPLAGIQ